MRIVEALIVAPSQSQDQLLLGTAKAWSLRDCHAAASSRNRADGRVSAAAPDARFKCSIFHHLHPLELFLTHHHPCRVTEFRCSYGVTPILEHFTLSDSA